MFPNPIPDLKDQTKTEKDTRVRHKALRKGKGFQKKGKPSSLHGKEGRGQGCVRQGSFDVGKVLFCPET